jgi:hypothetical protein
MTLPHRAAGAESVPSPIIRIAVNSAAQSENTIHDDAVAQRVGYRGALVPGVTLYAYMTQLVVPYLGVEWLRRGGASVRLLRPAYEDNVITCSATRWELAGEPALRLACTGEDGSVCADGSAWLGPTSPADLPDDLRLPERAPTATRPPLTPERVPLGLPLSVLETPLTVEAARAYADETRDPSSWWGEASPYGFPLLPPGMIAGRQARLLRHNFSYGPSIHVASEIHHLAAAPADACYRTGGVIRETFERKGHHYLLLDALTIASGTPVARVRHTVIYQVRGS